MCAKNIVSRGFAIALAMAVALALCASAFAADIQPCYTDSIDVMGNVSYSGQSYTATVTGPQSATKAKLEMTLYQKKTLGRKEVSSASASTNSRTCTKTQSATIEKGKTYVLEITAEVYSGGQWNTAEKTFTVKT